MNIDRRRLLKLVPLSGLTLIAGCGESDEEKVARVERALEAQKQGAIPADLEPAKQAEIKKQEAEDLTKKLVLLVAANLDDPFQRLQSALMDAAVRQLDGCRFKALDAAGSSETQLKQLADAQAQHPAFVVISPVDDKAVAKAVEALRREGTVVIGLDERFAPGTCSAVVFVSQKKLGLLAGQEVVTALKRKAADEGKAAVSGRVVHLTGDATSFAAMARSEGFHEALKAEPGIIIVHEAPAGWSREGGKARTEEALRLQHEWDVVCAHSDVIAQGATDALGAAQMRDRVLVVGMDSGLELVRKSVIDVTILQPMPLQTAFEYIRRSLTEPHFAPPSTTELQPEPVTPANLDEVMARGLRGGKE